MTEMTKPGRGLQEIAAEIRYLDNQAKRIVLGHAIEIGNRLLEAKELVPHGQWGDWLRSEFDYSQSSAQNFMRIAQEYGSAQMGLFGPEAKSQALGNLPYTKALRLLAVPEEERETFLSEHDVAHMSTRELEQAIRERNEAQERAGAAEAALHALEEQQGTAEQELRERLEKAADTERELRAEVKRLESRPVEVAVQVDQEAIDRAAAEAKAAADSAWQEKLTAAQKEAEKTRTALEKKLKTAEAQRDKAKEAADKAEAGAAERLKEAEDAAAKARAELEAAEKKLRLADPAVTEFGVHFRAVQTELAALEACAKRAEEADQAMGEKLRGALRQVLAPWAGIAGADS